MISILLREAVKHLRNKLQLDPGVVGIRSNKKPPPSCGDLYVSVYGAGITSIQPDLNTGIDIGFSVGITVTRRTGYNPYDYVDEDTYLADVDGMESILWKCCGWLHQNWDWLAAINASLTVRNASALQFIEPLRFKYMDEVPTVVNEQWFRPDASANFAAITSASQTYPYCGMIMEALLGDCRRVLTLSALQSELPLL